MLGGCIASQPEVIGAIALEDSPCGGGPAPRAAGSGSAARSAARGAATVSGRLRGLRGEGGACGCSCRARPDNLLVEAGLAAQRLLQVLGRGELAAIGAVQRQREVPEDLRDKRRPANVLP